MSKKPPIVGGSSFDEETLAGVMEFIESAGGTTPGAGDPVEEYALGQDIETEEEINIHKAQVMYEFKSSEQYPLIVESLMRMERREHRLFEDAEKDPDGLLRANWHATRRVIKEIIANIDSAASVFEESLRR